MKRSTKIRGIKKKAQKQVVSKGTQERRTNDKPAAGRITRYGKIVYNEFWDSGAPGPGADSECVYKWRGWYAARYSTGDIMGPYKSLHGAIKGAELNNVGQATVSIISSELKAGEIARMLRSDIDPPFTLEINDEIWGLSKDRKFVRENTQCKPN